MTEVLRQQLIDTALAMNASGLNQGASGNLSVRCEQGMLITPSCMDFTGLIPEDIVWMDFDGISRGLYKPSSECRFHAANYQHQPQQNMAAYIQAQEQTARIRSNASFAFRRLRPPREFLAE